MFKALARRFCGEKESHETIMKDYRFRNEVMNHIGKNHNMILEADSRLQNLILKMDVEIKHIKEEIAEIKAKMNVE